MKKYLILAAAAMTAVSCTQASLSEDAVREFAISHIENQVGYEAAVEGYYAATLSDLNWSIGQIPFGKIRQGHSKRLLKHDGSLFYEDSIKVELA